MDDSADPMTTVGPDGRNFGQESARQAVTRTLTPSSV